MPTDGIPPMPKEQEDAILQKVAGRKADEDGHSSAPVFSRAAQFKLMEEVRSGIVCAPLVVVV